MNAGEALEAARSFAFATLTERLGDGGLVVIAPHPDDESLACGGLIAEAHAKGRPVRVVIVSDGTGSHPASKTYPRARLRELREHEAVEAVGELGLEPGQQVVFLRLPDRFVPSDGARAEKAIARIVKCVEEVGARALFVTWRHDPHCDHQACYRIARRPAPATFPEAVRIYGLGIDAARSDARGTGQRWVPDLDRAATDPEEARDSRPPLTDNRSDQ